MPGRGRFRRFGGAGPALVFLDSSLTRLLWGWPGTFIKRVRAHGGSVLIYSNEPARMAPLLALGINGIVTDRI